MEKEEANKNGQMEFFFPILKLSAFLILYLEWVLICSRKENDPLMNSFRKNLFIYFFLKNNNKILKKWHITKITLKIWIIMKFHSFQKILLAWGNNKEEVPWNDWALKTPRIGDPIKNPLFWDPMRK